MASEKPLLSKLSAMLGVIREHMAVETPAPEPVVSEPAVDPVLAARIEETTTVIRAMTKLLTSLKDKMALLRAVAMELGAVPRAPVEVKASLAVHRDALVEYLRNNRAAAQMVGSVVLRFQEASEDLKILREQAESGAWGSSNLETFKGRYLFLCKMSIYFKDFPPLHQLFVPSAAALPSARQAAAPTPPVRPVPAPPQPSEVLDEEARVVTQGQKLLKGLADRVPAMQAAVTAALGRPQSPTLMLTVPAQQTARKLATMLAGDQALFNRVQRYLQQFQHAKLMMSQRPVKNLPHLQQALALLAGYHVQFQDNPFLHELFVVRAA